MGHSAIRWFSDDGEEFKSEAEMIRYEMKKVDEQEIDLFIAEYKCTVRRKSEYTKVLRAWQEFKNEQLVKLNDESTSKEEKGQEDSVVLTPKPVTKTRALILEEEEALARIREEKEIEDSFSVASKI